MNRSDSGRPLREAARRVREAGHATQRALAHAQAVMMCEDIQPEAEQRQRTRVSDDDSEPAPPPKTRVAENLDDEVIDTVGTEARNDERARR